jgi:D-alanyl-D-alanine carboxypeptidase
VSSAGRPPQRSGAPAAPPRRASKLHLTARGRIVLIVVVAVAVLLGGRALLSGGAEGGPTPSASGRGRDTGTPTATTTASTTAPAVASLPDCRNAVLPAPDDRYGTWERTLLDTTFALPADYTPPDLVPATEAGSTSPQLVRSFVVPDLRALLRASDDDGTPVDVLVGYRSYARQEALFREHVRELGYAGALAKTARPGHSEHQLGTTIDFRTKGDVDVDENWESEPAGAWMAANGWRFGFVLSYPRDREDVTCYHYEPWHYRYFGRPVAARIHESGLTPREFLWRLDSSSPGPSGTDSA